MMGSQWASDEAGRLVLGTVQFGVPYGISNVVGQTPLEEARAIVQKAFEAGVRWLDTAPAYGTSETVLGNVARDPLWHVVTKTPTLPHALDPAHVVAVVTQSLERSLVSLGRTAVDALLVHRAEDLLGTSGEALWKALENLRHRGLVRSLGVSVYSPEELEAVGGRFPLEIVQVPCNVLDQRFLANDLLGGLRRSGVQVHGRSAFLQGLLLLDPATLPVSFSPWQPLLQRWQDVLHDHHLTPLEACLGFALGVSELDGVVVGVNTASQMEELLRAARSWDQTIFREFATTDVGLIEPRRWE